MHKFDLIQDANGEMVSIETSLTGYELLSNPKLNKGAAFSREERDLFLLNGLLPYHVETLEQQVSRMYVQYREHQSHLSKNIYLNVLHDYNETLFYNLVSQHLDEMLPIIYTPTVGEAVERFSLELRKPQGLYLSYAEIDQLENTLEKTLPADTRLIVVTDGEAVLGLGDQGIGGIKICHAKGMVYTLCAGINPHQIFSIQLDVGTNNQKLLSDPMYLGWRHERIEGAAYDDFVERFVRAIQKKLPTVYLHWEDVGRDNARRILERYRHDICTINGDMQSTGVVTLAAILAACKASGRELKDHRIVIFGAGTAGVGIADQICMAMQQQGLSKEEAYRQFWLLDKNGLLIENQVNLMPFQQPYVRRQQEITSWSVTIDNPISLLDVVREVKPTILIGCSTVGGAFNKDIITTMAKYTEKPIILPLSNPTSKSEALPENLLEWTEGRAIIATGGPFPDALYQGRLVRIAQSNNALAFPGIGLGALAVKAKYVSDDMLWVAAKTLSECSPILQNQDDPLLPKVSETKSVSRKIAVAVAEQAKREGLAQIEGHADLDRAIRFVTWEPKYYPYRKI